MKKINLTIIIFFLCAIVFGGELDDYLIILHSNDIHGRAITTNEFFGYGGIKKSKENLEKQGASVFLFDAGDFSQGTPIVNLSKGSNAIDFMNRATYDAATLGNHEFDFGLDVLLNNLKDAKFKVLTCNILQNNKSLFEENVILTDKKGNKIGVFGLDTPSCSTSVNPKYVEGLSFPAGEELYKLSQKQIDYLKGEKCALIVCLGHLGDDEVTYPNRSIDLINNTRGIDLFIDGHSHTRIVEGKKENNTIRVSTGCYFNSIGYVAYKINSNSEYEYIKSGLYDRNDPFISVIANGKVGEVDKNLEKYINDIYKNIENSQNKIKIDNKVNLNGDRVENRTKETNLGDLTADAVLSYGKRIDNKCVASIVNGGGIRNGLNKGTVSNMDLSNVFPFGNIVYLIKIKGKDLLEALEVACCICPKENGGFPQISGMEIEIDTTKEFIKGEPYPNSVYFAPKSINRVSIKSIGGEKFDLDKDYIIGTLDFLANGGDTYTAFKNGSSEGAGEVLLDVVRDYITNELKSVIDERYTNPQGRIVIK